MDQNSAMQKLDLRGFVKINLNVIYFLGYFCPDYGKVPKKLCYHVYTFISVGFIFVLCLLSQLIDMVAVFGDIEKMTDALFLTLTNVSAMYKLYNLIWHSDRVRKLIRSINRAEFKPRNWTQYYMLVEDMRMSRFNSTMFIFMCVVTCSLWAIFPFFDKGADGKMRLPLSGWFPFDVDESPTFEVVYVYQTVTAVLNGVGAISMDMFLMGLIMVISGQLRILNNAFQIMKLKYGMEPERIRRNDEEIREDLVRNALHHKSIIQFADEVTFLFTTGIFLQFTFTVVLSCITMFQLTLVPMLSIQFLSMLFYQACVLLEIYFWCYYGNEVILKSEKLTESAYMCEWVDCSKEFKKDLLSFMTRSQIPLKLYAGGYFTLSLETYMAIVKSSFSYFAVLNRVHSEEN